ncbi:hypothetical protein Q31a_48010 [Aureliella helgolandensis]|uniref:Uncharacterized protein n=1 Tax=Aureliella helgolandensis TaxID=2527968 RepID=A0A518GCZ2_9BACT|nr:hypothetical protein Q31a_48010 [Aureliella helgolandensis]
MSGLRGGKPKVGGCCEADTPNSDINSTRSRQDHHALPDTYGPISDAGIGTRAYASVHHDLAFSIVETSGQAGITGRGIEADARGLQHIQPLTTIFRPQGCPKQCPPPSPVPPQALTMPKTHLPHSHRQETCHSPTVVCRIKEERHRHSDSLPWRK